MSSPTTSMPTISQRSGLIERLNSFLDKKVLPYPIKFLTNRVVILITLCFLAPLLLYAANQPLVNALNSYLNVMSVVVSSTVLLYATISDVRDRAAAQRREEIAQAHDAAVDRRADSDHELIQKIHEHIDEIRGELTQHVNESLNNIEQILIDRLETIQDEDHQHIEEMHKVVLVSTESHREELADLRELVEALHRSVMGKPTASEN